MISVRVFAVLSAACLVAAFALASILPPDLPLAAAIALLDHRLLYQVQQSAARMLPVWAWNWGVVPLLMRPVWLLPASFGIIFAGVAVTTSSGPSRSHRRRS